MSPNNEVIKIFSDIADARTMRRFFNEMFTPAEIQDVALRWRLMKLLHEGNTQRDIARRLGISLCKITRGSKVLKARNSVSKRILEQPKGVKDASRKKAGKFT